MLFATQQTPTEQLSCPQVGTQLRTAALWKCRHSVPPLPAEEEEVSSLVRNGERAQNPEHPFRSWNKMLKSFFSQLISRMNSEFFLKHFYIFRGSSSVFAEQKEI